MDAADRAIAQYDLTSAAERTLGRRWYPEARRIARQVGPTLHRGAGLIAAYSPNTSWRGNLTLARTAAAGELRGMPDSRRKAGAILSGARPLDVLGGPKVRAFYQAIASGGARGPAVIDRWMFRALESEDTLECQAAVAVAAETRDERVHDMQAILWVAVRGGAA